MMRYHRVSPDVLPSLSNGRKPILRTWKEEVADHSGTNPNHSLYEGKPIKARSVLGTANPSSARDHQFSRISFPSDSFTAAGPHERQPPASTSATPSPAPAKAQSRPYEVNTVTLGGGVVGVGGDVVLQWGRRKRSRGARADHRTSGDDASAHSRPVLKIQRTSLMHNPLSGGGRANLRTSLPVCDATAAVTSRGVEDRSSGAPRPEKRSPPSPHRNVVVDVHPPEPKLPADHHDVPPPIAEKLSLDQLEWPKICISLSRTEKEDDFLIMKGTKLPQRPKKRAKIIDKNLQYCFPGMWLSDLTRGRYEVREKKCVKKRRRGLKGMENMDSDSE